jgi:ribose 5-phosphate isomerase B
MRIAVGSDESTYLTDFAIAELKRRGHELRPVGALAPGNDARWPTVGRDVGNLVASNACDEGLLFCFTGTGVSIAANKVPRIRAALCWDAQTAAGARQYNHANVLVMSLRATSTEAAREMLDAWFTTPFGDGEDQECVELLNSTDHQTVEEVKS